MQRRLPGPHHVNPNPVRHLICVLASTLRWPLAYLLVVVKIECGVLGMDWFTTALRVCRNPATLVLVLLVCVVYLYNVFVQFVSVCVDIAWLCSG